MNTNNNNSGNVLEPEPRLSQPSAETASAQAGTKTCRVPGCQAGPFKNAYAERKHFRHEHAETEGRVPCRNWRCHHAPFKSRAAETKHWLRDHRKIGQSANGQTDEVKKSRRTYKKHKTMPEAQPHPANVALLEVPNFCPKCGHDIASHIRAYQALSLKSNS